MVILVNLAQLANAYSPILSSRDGSLIFSNSLHPENALAPIDFKLPGRFILVNPLHS